MKKSLFVMLIALFSILSFNEAKAQNCPTGYSQTTQSFYVNGCYYEVIVCFKCNVAMPSDVRIQGFSKVVTIPECNQTWTTNQVYEALYNAVSTPNNLASLGCVPGPCDGTSNVEFTEVYEICWEKTRTNGIVRYWPCNMENCYCIQLFKICWNGTNYEKRLIQRDHSCPGYQENPISKCPGLEPNDPAEGVTTSCFHLATPCFP